MKSLHSLIFCLLFMLACNFKSVNSNSIFFVKLDEFENHEGLLSSHVKCDNGKKCDPSFLIKVKGPWGEVENQSSCYVDQNFIKFDGTLGSAVSNPLSYPESSLHFPITLDIRVKDCLFGSPDEDIADFYQEVSDLPSAFSFSDSVDPETDTERVRKLELQSMMDAPVSIKLRVAIWHKCASYYYGSDCSKFCNTNLPGYECNNNGVPVCVSAACQIMTAPIPSTTTSTTQTTAGSVATTSTVNPTTTLRTSTTSTVAKTITYVNARTTISTASKLDLASTQAWESTWKSTSQKSNKSNVIPSTSATTTAKLLDNSKSAVPFEANATALQVDSTMLVAMAAILVAMLLAVVTILVLLKQCTQRKVNFIAQAPAASTSVRFNRDEIGCSVSLADQSHMNFTNLAAYACTDPSGNTEASGHSRAATTRADSDVYEDPVDPGERTLPPVPSRDLQCHSIVRLQG